MNAWYVISRCIAVGTFLCIALSAEVDRRQLVDYMDRVRVEMSLPGLAVAIAQNGEIVFSEGVGFAELDNRTPQTGRSVHNIGSVSKVVAATGVMQLVEAGKIDLDAEIQTYLSYYPKKKYPVTLRHILTHTSGTRHYNGTEFGEDGHPTSEKTLSPKKEVRLQMDYSGYKSDETGNWIERKAVVTKAGSTESYEMITRRQISYY